MGVKTCQGTTLELAEKVGFLVIPNTECRNPYCAETLCLRVCQGTGFIGATTMFELPWKNTASELAENLSFLVIPTRSVGIPFVPKLSTSAIIRAQILLVPQRMCGISVEEHGFSRAGHCYQYSGL